MSLAQQTAMHNYRSRLKVRGMVRMEIQVGTGDVPLMRQVAAILRDDATLAERVREKLRELLSEREKPSLRELLTSAPLEGLDLELERSRDCGREVDL